MAFNLGQTRLAGFKRLRAAALAGDWDRAAAEALDSRWASQTGRRAAEVAALLRTWSCGRRAEGEVRYLDDA